MADLRKLNQMILEQAERVRKQVAIEAPPAVCPRVQRLVRNVVFDARRFPGVTVSQGKSNLSEDF